MSLLSSRPVRQKLRTADGFTLIDMVVVMAMIGTLAAIAIPTMQRINDAIALGQAQRLVQSTLQQARLKAVTSNRIMRVRFNCPAAGQMRAVELIGTPLAPAAQDTAVNRCSDTVYPYPAPDNNAVTSVSAYATAWNFIVSPLGREAERPA